MTGRTIADYIINISVGLIFIMSQKSKKKKNPPKSKEKENGKVYKQQNRTREIQIDLADLSRELNMNRKI